MAGYSDIIGHEKIIEHLQAAVSTGKVSHAYIFNGPKFSGKKMLAESFAMALQCENGDPCGCRQCRSCRQAMDHNQPDIIHVTHEKPGTIGVDDIRVQINGDIQVRPYSSRYKIYIVDEAEKMNQQAQNALLKTIEEPPAYGIILLLTTNSDNFLPTILSRCIRMDLKSVPAAQIQKHLMKQYKIPDYQAEIAASFAQGNVGKAIRLAASEGFAEMKNSALSLMGKLEDMDLQAIGPAVAQITEFKSSIGEYLDLLTVWFRDVLYMKATGDTRGLIFKDQVYEVKKQAARHSYEGIEKILEAIALTASRLEANVNFELSIELLLFVIKEN